MYYVHCRAWGESVDEVLDLCKRVLYSFALDKAAWIREGPWAEAETDFDTKTTKVNGGVRFSFQDLVGEWQYVNTNVGVPSFGKI